MKYILAKYIHKDFRAEIPRIIFTNTYFHENSKCLFNNCLYVNIYSKISNFETRI